MWRTEARDWYTVAMLSDFHNDSSLVQAYTSIFPTLALLCELGIVIHTRRQIAPVNAHGAHFVRVGRADGRGVGSNGLGSIGRSASRLVVSAWMRAA